MNRYFSKKAYKLRGEIWNNAQYIQLDVCKSKPPQNTRSSQLERLLRKIQIIIISASEDAENMEALCTVSDNVC
jgi:hypothetical protein